MTVHFDCEYHYPDGFTLDVKFDACERMTAICGPSGSGKTTILMLIAGLLRPRRGRIVLGDRVLMDTSTRKWTPPHRRSVGVVFQDSLLFPHRDVRANLAYGLKRRPVKRYSFDQVVDALELAELLDRYPATLSGGQARRVAIGRALLRGPSLLMLDEPWVGLDEPLRDRVAALVRRCVAQWQIPTLLVGHDSQYVRSITDAVIEVRDGRIEQQATDQT